MEVGRGSGGDIDYRSISGESCAARTERGQVGPCPTDEDHRPLSERVRVLAATLVPGLMQQRSLRHNLQVESFHLLCSDQLHCRSSFQGVACRFFVNGRPQERPEKFRLLHGTPNPFSMRADMKVPSRSCSPGWPFRQNRCVPPRGGCMSHFRCRIESIANSHHAQICFQNVRSRFISSCLLSLITNRLLSDVSILIGSGRQVISLIRTKNRPPSCPGLPRASTCSLPEQERRGWP